MLMSVYHVVLVYYFSMLSSEGSRKMSYYSSIVKGLQGLGIGLAFGINSIKTGNMMTIGICYGVIAILSLIPFGYAFWIYLDPTPPSEVVEPHMTDEVGSMDNEKGVDVKIEERPVRVKEV